MTGSLGGQATKQTREHKKQKGISIWLLHHGSILLIQLCIELALQGKFAGFTVSSCAIMMIAGNRYSQL
jgi:hypothetical protein